MKGVASIGLSELEPGRVEIGAPLIGDAIQVQGSGLPDEARLQVTIDQARVQVERQDKAALAIDYIPVDRGQGGGRRAVLAEPVAKLVFTQDDETGLWAVEPTPDLKVSEHEGLALFMTRIGSYARNKQRLTQRAYEQIAENWETMQYRPTIVAAIQNTAGQLLFGESAKHPGAWNLIQGGMRPDEEPADALIREATEEVGLTAASLTPSEILATRQLKTPTSHIDKRGFERGKLYVVMKALYDGSEEITPNPAEIADTAWVTKEVAGPYLAGKRFEKRDLLEIVLNKLRPRPSSR